jgi:dolichol-phosphate mannosyltransferase
MLDQGPGRSPRTWVIVPTYDEAGNLRALVERVLAQPGVDGMVVVDDGSPDGTGALAEALAAETGRVVVVQRGAKLGLGTAYKAGIAQAQRLGAERVMTMDADFSHPPERIGALLAASAQHSLVIGSRYVPGGCTVNWGLHRRVLSHGANMVARSVLGLPARDCTAGFRCYHADLLEQLDLASIRSSDYSFLVEMLFACHRLGASVAEVPITFADRSNGESKISHNEIWRALRTVSRLAGVRARRAWARSSVGRPRLSDE